MFFLFNYYTLYALVFITSLHTLLPENLSNMIPDPLYSMYHYSHPPLLERLRAIEQGVQVKGAKNE